MVGLIAQKRPKYIHLWYNILSELLALALKKRKDEGRLETTINENKNERELGVRALIKDAELDFLSQEETETKHWSTTVEESNRQRTLNPLIQTGERLTGYNVYGEMLDMLMDDTSEIELGR